MKHLEQCTYSQEQEAESLQTSFWDTDQSLQSNGTNTHAMSSEQEQQMDGLRDCQCGKEMSNCSIHPSTKAEWIAFMQDSLARILAKPESKQVLAKTRALDFTAKSYALQTYYSLDTCSWKTSQQSLVEMMGECSEPSLETLPREATIVSGVVYPLPKLELTTNEIDGGAWPTPTASDVEGGVAQDVVHEKNSYYRINKKGVRFGVKLRDAVNYQHIKMWPTPMAHENRLGYQNRNNSKKGTQKSLTTEVIDDLGGRNKVTGQLNPQWVEWLMGWPIGHTELKP